MNVLIGTPTYADALCAATEKSVKAQKFDGQWEWQVIDHNPYPAPDSRNVLASYQHLREVFLAGSWDALLTVEHDMLLPSHALQSLVDTGAPVAYGVYLLRHGALVINACEYVGERNMGESFSLHRDRMPKSRGVVEVSGVGFGCTLMRRDVVEQYPFTDRGDIGKSPDVPFAKDMVRRHVKQVADFGVICGHIENGKVLMPFEDDKAAMRRCIAVQTMNVGTPDGSVHIIAGQEYELPLSVVMELSRAGYVHPVVNADGTSRSSDPLLQKADAPGSKRRKPAQAD